MSSQDAFKELLKQIADYFNKNVTEVDAKKISFFIIQYVNTLPREVRIKKVKEVERVYVPVLTKVTTAFPVRMENTGLYMDKLAKNICDSHGITVAELRRVVNASRRSGKRKYVGARQEFSNIAVAAGVSKVQIGKFLGYRDHSAVVNLTNYRSTQKMLP